MNLIARVLAAILMTILFAVVGVFALTTIGDGFDFLSLVDLVIAASFAFGGFCFGFVFYRPTGRLFGLLGRFDIDS